MSKRPRQTDCRIEPPYPDHQTGVFTMSAPDEVAHPSRWRCRTEYPHRIEFCGEMADRAAGKEGA